MQNSENAKNKRTVTKVKKYQRPVVTVLKRVNKAPNYSTIELKELICRIWSGYGSIANLDLNPNVSNTIPSHNQ